MGVEDMQLLLSLVTAIIQGTTLYFVYALAKDLARIRTTLDRGTDWGPVAPKPVKPASSHVHARVKHVIWVWRQETWELDLASVPAGSEPGTPPSFRGAFEGHRVRKEAAGW